MVFFDDSHKKFELHDKGFVYKKKSYKYTDIIHISYEGITTDYRMNFVSMDELREAICEIEMKSGKKIKHIIEEAQYLVGFSQDKRELIEELIKVYILLLKKSFESRLAGYQQEIEQFGYFSYPGAKIYPGKIVLRNDRNTTFTTSDSKFSKTSREFVMTRKHADPNMSLADKLVRKAFGVGMEIEERITTIQDPDIFYFLIAENLGVRFA